MTLLGAIISASPNNASRRDAAGFQLLLSISVSLFVPAALAQAQLLGRPTPNVVLIVADDIGMGDIQGLGGFVPTPNIDRLLQAGMSFSDAHTAAAMCHASRFGIITGSDAYRTPSRYGFSGYFRDRNGLISGQHTHKTLGDVMKGIRNTQGNPIYTTSFIGKMSLEWPALARHGYDYAFGLPTGIQASTNYIIDADAQLITDNSDSPWSDGMFGNTRIEMAPIGALLASQARSFIEQNSDAPFFLHYNSQAIHAPHHPPDIFTRYDGIDVPVKDAVDVTGEPLSRVGAMLFELDLQVGVILETLQAEGLEKNTLVVFTSDNGAAFSLPQLQYLMPENHYSAGHVLNSNGELRPLRGGKNDMWEGGVRVPLIVKWGDGTRRGSFVTPGATNDQLVSTNDIMATLYDLTSQAMEQDQAMDSVSLLPTLFDPNRRIREEMHLLSSANAEDQLVGAMRMDDQHGEWVLVFEQSVAHEPEGDYRLENPGNLLAAGLYELTHDPEQSNNLLSNKIRINGDETPVDGDLVSINDDISRQRVADMISSFFAHWERGDPRTTNAVDYSDRVNRTRIPILSRISKQPLKGQSWSFVWPSVTPDQVVVPEPSSLGLISLSALAGLVIRRRSS